MQTTDIRFWDRTAKRYSRRPVPNKEAYEKKLRKTQELLTPSSVVLEIGCGTGSTAIRHAKYAKTILATDFSSKMIELANAKALESGVSNVTFLHQSVEALDVADESYDMIMAHSLLHLTAKPQAVIEKAYRGLKPGGVLIQNTVCLGDLQGFLVRLLPLGRALRLIPRINFFSKQELDRMLAVAGFQTEYEWRAQGSDAVFMVSRKRSNSSSELGGLI